MKTILNPLNPVAGWCLGLGVTPALCFCLVGFMATFEPAPPVKQWSWRTTYGVAATACLSGLLKLVRFPRARASSSVEPITSGRNA